MKFMIISDIHGSAYYFEKILKCIKSENPDKIIVLGDILYHGPRNDLPKGYDSKKVIELINPLKNKIVAVRGNCDAEVDQMVLDFSILSDYAYVYADDTELFLTHGHLSLDKKLLSNKENCIVLSGHTHIPLCEKTDGVLYINPGSVSIPKDDSPHSYMIFENKKFVWKDLDMQAYKEYIL